MRGTGEYTILFLVNRKLVRRFIMFEQEIESIAAGGSNEEIYYNLLNLTKKAIDRKGRIEGKKKVYYISAEFLIGKLLSNNLINLGLYDTVNISFTDLKQVLLLFAKEMFGEDTKIRLRPSYFPFTEPSAEMDISCNICGGKGCPFCKHTGWVEILGCGMVDPNVLESNGIDSKVYSGYALGMGIERITNLKYQVKDLRMFSENDTRFLKEFEAAY